jgi:hypothetical protein
MEPVALHQASRGGLCNARLRWLREREARPLRCYLTVPCRPAQSAREAIRQKTQGEEYQPTDNHSKLTDSNDCTDYFSYINLLLLFRLPSSLCLLPDILARLFMSSLHDRDAY